MRLLPQTGSASGLCGSLLRWPSQPLLLDFQGFATERGGVPPEVEVREWVREIWNAWFDEVFPPLKESASRIIVDSRRNALVVDSERTETREVTPELENVDLSKALPEGVTVADLQEEVEALSQAMAQQKTVGAFDLCRRGGLYKKLGLLNQAMEDLNQVNTAALIICHHLFLNCS